MKNLEDLGLVHLDEVGDEKSFIVIVQDEEGFYDVMQGTRSQIIEFVSEVFEIEEDEFDSTREILEYCEDINGDGAPYVQIISPHPSFVSI
mgnify:FL=1